MSRISIVIPLYNKAPFVQRTLESIASQTYTAWECIIVNDGSTDKSADVVRDVICNMENGIGEKFHLIEQGNAGVSAARNLGISVSDRESDFVCFLDADDWWAPIFLEEMVKLTAQYPKAGVFACNYYKVKNGKLISFFDQPTGSADYFKMYQTIAMPITSISVMVRRDVLESVAEKDADGNRVYFKPNLKLGEDFDLWIRLCMKSQFVWCNEHLAYYNNDVPVNARAIGNLHHPKHHILWNLEDIEERLAMSDERTRESYKCMIDTIRVYSLMPYYLSNDYRKDAIEQLRKVDWTKQPMKYRLQYKMPIWLLKVKNRFMRMGSFYKQKLLKIIR